MEHAESRVMVTGVKQGGDEGIVGEAVLCGHFVEQTAGVAGVELGRATVHEENGIGGREGAWNVPGLEQELVKLSAGGNAAGAEELDAAVNVNGDGHHSTCSAGEQREGAADLHRPCPSGSRARTESLGAQRAAGGGAPCWAYLFIRLEESLSFKVRTKKMGRVIFFYFSLFEK
jgi:hypothetical protein